MELESNPPNIYTRETIEKIKARIKGRVGESQKYYDILKRSTANPETIQDARIRTDEYTRLNKIDTAILEKYAVITKNTSDAYYPMVPIPRKIGALPPPAPVYRPPQRQKFEFTQGQIATNIKFYSDNDKFSTPVLDSYYKKISATATRLETAMKANLYISDSDLLVFHNINDYGKPIILAELQRRARESNDYTSPYYTPPPVSALALPQARFHETPERIF